jgi:hypothetical protein
MLMSIITAPIDASQQYVPPPQPPKLDQLDHEIVEEFRRHGHYGAPIWTPLNALAESAGPEDRDELRQIKLELWRRLRALLRAGVLHRFDRGIVTVTKVHRERTARRKRRVDAGSTLPHISETDAAPAAKQFSTISLKEQALSPTTSLEPQKIESAEARPGTTVNDRRREKIRNAASALARLRHLAKRPWSGFIGEQRIRRDQRIILADGRRVFALWRAQGSSCLEPASGPPRRRAVRRAVGMGCGPDGGREAGKYLNQRQ